jgi:ribosomal protein L11 methyltransferase
LTVRSNLPRPTTHETVWVDVPGSALAAYEAALQATCDTVGYFECSAKFWRIEGVKPTGQRDAELTAALALAASLTTHPAALERAPIQPADWIARTRAAFPEQVIGKRFLIRGSHDTSPDSRSRITLTLDAGLAFGSGEHASTRLCLLALERLAHRRPRRILDLGTGSGILAIAAARLLRRHVLATDIDPWSVRVARENARLNHVSHLVQCTRSDGWKTRGVRRAGPYDLVLANILARPLAAMARDLARNLRRGGHAVLSGFLGCQTNLVRTAHLRHGLKCAYRLSDEGWTTLVVRRVSGSDKLAPLLMVGDKGGIHDPR